MTTPTNHTLSIPDQRGNQVRGKVVYLQPKSERWNERHALVHIVTSGWLDCWAVKYRAMPSLPPIRVVLPPRARGCRQTPGGRRCRMPKYTTTQKVYNA